MTDKPTLWGPGSRYRLRGRQITDEMIRSLKEQADVVSVVYQIAEEQGVGIARDLYAKVYGFSVDDISIDQKIERTFVEEVFGERARSKIEVPDHLLLAIVLRQGFGGRPRGTSKSVGRLRSDMLAMRKFEERTTELKIEMPAGKAKEQAADEITKISTLSRSAILEGRLHRRRPSRTKKKPTKE